MKPSLNNNLDEKYLRAKERVKELKGFYTNLLLYLLIIPFLAFLNYKTYWEVKWFIFSAIGWGIGLSFHAYRVFSRNPIFGKRWEQRKIEQFIQEEQNNTWN
ncbi:MAG: 2TM domain-containing protein [Jejuia sp.]